LEVFHLIYQKPIKCNQIGVGGGGTRSHVQTRAKVDFIVCTTLQTFSQFSWCKLYRRTWWSKPCTQQSAIESIADIEKWLTVTQDGLLLPMGGHKMNVCNN
jgi:hypothetical protein